MSLITLNKCESVRRLDEIVESFEAARLVADQDVRDFIPHPLTGDNRRIAVELLCVDMQYQWAQSNRKTVDDYRAEFAELLSSPSDVQELALEEFRLRRSLNENVSAEQFQHRYLVDVTGWTAAETDTKVDISTSTSVVELGMELVRLTNAIQCFPSVGDRIGDFELVDELGRGSFGIVYLARQGELEQRLVALKITTLADIESGFLARLQHTHIVPVYSIHNFGHLQGICMPYYGRDTLASLFENGERPASSDREYTDAAATESDSARLAIQIAEGLQHAHEQGIVHRDLKPANVLLNEDGAAMLLDFNLSQDVVSGGRSCLMVGGTLPYLAPEHVRAIQSGEGVGPTSDIFSLGVILYQLLSNRLPYPQRYGVFDDAVGRMIQDRQEPPKSLRAVNPRVSPGMASIVHKMLAADTTHRYGSMREVREDLKRHLGNRPLKHAINPSLPERVSKWSRRHPKLSSATSVATFALLLIALLAAALADRGQRIDRQHALAQLNEVRTQVPRIRSLISMPVVDDVSRRNGIVMAREVVDKYGLFDSGPWSRSAVYSALDEDEQRELLGILSQVLYLLGSAESRASRLADEGEQQVMQEQAEKALAMAQQLLGSLQHDGDAGSNPGDARSPDRNTSFLHAARLLQQFRYEQALPVLEALRDAEPFDVSTWRVLGNAYAAVGRLKDAESCFNVCVSMWPDSHLGYFHRGMCRMDLKRFADAEADFSRALQRQTDYVPALINRAVARREQNLDRTAEADLTRALELGASQTRIYFLRAELRERLHNLDGAKEDWHLGMKLIPTDEESWIKRGLVQLKADHDAALRDFQAARELNPRSHAALRNIAHVYAEKQHRPAAALEVISQLIESHQGRTGDIVSRGVLLARMGRRDEALADAKRVLASAPTAKELVQVACIYSLTSDTQPADAQVGLALAERAITKDPRWLGVAMSDADLEAVRELPEYPEVLTAIQNRIQRNVAAQETIATAVE